MSDSEILWTAEDAIKEQAAIHQYKQWLGNREQRIFDDYHALWKWSVENPALFWKSIWHFFDVKSHTPYKQVMSADPMPRTRWFAGATLNYAEHVFKNKTPDYPALIFSSERQNPVALSWNEFEDRTAALQAFLKHENIGEGDRVAAFLPNIPEASIALMAAISLGAVWSSCSPDFGTESVLDRFRQIGPKILIAADGYVYNGKEYDRMEVVKKIAAALPSVEKIVLIPYLNENVDIYRIPSAVSWRDVIQTEHGELTFTPVPFSHPVWVLYSSGTTGIPKAITHGHGGMLLEHLKYLSLHNDVKPGEKFFWFSTTGWMMWNFVQASLLVGATAVLYDGSPGYPNLERLWELTEEIGIHHFGISAPYLLACKKKQLRPGKTIDLSTLRSIGSTGSPLPPDGFKYVYEHIKKDVWLCSMSGGTDVCTAWVGSNILKPVIEGEIQCRCLGASMFAFDQEGNPVKDEVGEMVLTQPMPCMPVYFWGDKDFERYCSGYFEMFPGVWRHGDWIRITPDGGVVILGRSDATLNRQGVRIGTAEVYRALAGIKELKDSLIVNLELSNGNDFMPLFVVMEDSLELTEPLKMKINTTLRETYTPRHVPDAIFEVPDLPYTISGKKMETPVKKMLMRVPPEEAAHKGAMRNPGSLDYFIEFAKQVR